MRLTGALRMRVAPAIAADTKKVSAGRLPLRHLFVASRRLLYLPAINPEVREVAVLTSAPAGRKSDNDLSHTALAKVKEKC